LQSWALESSALTLSGDFPRSARSNWE